MFKRYKEILFAFGLGVAMWLIDVWMHVELGAEVHAESFLSELLRPQATTLIFRLIYLVIAVAFGIVLWRANWRERELQALEDSIISFYCQMDLPTLRILTRVRQLQCRTTVKADIISSDLAENIEADALLLSEFAGKYQEFSRHIRNKQTLEAIETLRSIEMPQTHKRT